MRTLKTLLATVTVLGLSISATTPSSAISSISDLKNAPVPSMCDYPAGTLVDGELPGVSPGNVTLNSSRLGNLISGGKEAVSTFWCSHGGIGWPDNAVFYDGATQVVGQFDSGTVGSSPGRQAISKVQITHGAAVLTVLAVPRSGDNELWGSSGARAVYRWSASRQRMTQRSVQIHTETSTVRTIVKAAKAGKKSTVRKHATKSATASIMYYFKQAKKDKASIKFSKCYGVYSFEDVIPDSGLVQFGQRACVVNVRYPKGSAVPHVLIMKHPSKDVAWRTWVAIDFVPIWH